MLCWLACSGDEPVQPAPPAELPHAHGDPLVPFHSTGFGDQTDWHTLDVVILDDERAFCAGEGGVGVVRVSDGRTVWTQDHERVFDLAWDATLERIYLGTREAQVAVGELSEPETLTVVDTLQDWEGVHEDLAADAGRLLVAAPQTGAVLLDGATGETLAVLPASWAGAVGLAGDRAVVADGHEVVLWDVSEPAASAELDRLALRASGRDVAFDGRFVGVALGGHGVGVVEVVDDALVLRGELDLPGAAYGVALDGEELWVAAWTEVALVWLGHGGPVVLGSEPVSYAALGLDARDGRGVVADWAQVVSLDRVPGVAGPELTLPAQAWSDGADPPGAQVRVDNLGATTLAADLSCEGATVDVDVLALDPGESAVVSVTGAAGEDLDATLRLATNDPDEATAVVLVQTGEASVGQPHPPLRLGGYVYPDTTTTPYDLQDQVDRVVFLAYFSVT